MDLNDREKDLLEGLKGVTKSALSIIPGLGQAIAGWDSYQRSNFERNLLKTIKFLEDKVANLQSFFSGDFFRTEEGQQFTRKVFDCAFDTQYEDKQELFINALVNGADIRNYSELERLKFVDMLRNLSRASLLVLAEMHKTFIKDVRGPNRSPDSTSAFPLINSAQIAEKLGSKFHPYLVTSAINEMESQGLFSETGEWKKSSFDGSYVSGPGFTSGLCYTDFTARFVEFISTKDT